MDTLGIDVGASVSDNMRTFKRMTNETGAFQYDEVVVWFQALSKKSECQGLSACAEALVFFCSTYLKSRLFWVL